MKTKTFISELEALGMTVETGAMTYILYEGDAVARTYIRDEGVIDTDYMKFRELSEARKAFLLKLLYKYARTPIEDRGEDKKYYITMKHINSQFNYFNYAHDEKPHIINSSTHSSAYQTKFTKEEIKKYDLQKFVDNELFELIPVEEDE